MAFRVGITNQEWFDLLASQPSLDEVSFWQPGGNREFHALKPGELFLFKPRGPNNVIAGGGVFAHASIHASRHDAEGRCS